MTAAEIDALIARTATRLLPWDPQPITGLGALMGRMINELREQRLDRLRDYASSTVLRDGASEADARLWAATVRLWRRATEEIGSADPVLLGCLEDGYAAIRLDPSVIVTALVGCATRPPAELREPAPKEQRPNLFDLCAGNA